MKQINRMIWLFLVSLLPIACFEDDNKYEYVKLDEIVIEGIERSYVRKSHQDILSITPTVTTDADVEYAWELWTSVRTDGIIYKPDTIGREKNLNYEVMEDPGTYYLVFNVKDKKTGVTTVCRSTLNVETLNSTGWYLLKDEEVAGEMYTDYDFIYDGGRIDNWIAFYNNGKKLKGEAVKSIFSSNYSDQLSGGGYNYINVLMPVSKEEVSVLEVSNGIVRLPFESLFFESLEVKNFQDISIQNDGTNVGLVNDHRFYNMSTQNATSFYASYGDYNVASGIMRGLNGPTFFDSVTESFVYVSYGNITRFPAVSGDLTCNNMNADLLWSSVINFRVQGTKWYAYALMKKHTGENPYMLIKFRLNWGDTENRVEQVNILPSTLNLVTAERWAVNANYGIIYFVKDQKLYRYSIDSGNEEVILNIPAGEEVTCMQHIIYPNLMSADDYGSVIDQFAVATYANGKYKVWLYEFDAGNLKPLSKPTFEGNGRVACINYVSGNSSNFLF